MSTYINPSKPSQHGDYSDSPPIVLDYLRYSESIRGLSPRTVNGYYIDLRTFFKYMVQRRGLAPQDLPLEQIIISQIDLAFIRGIEKADIYEFLYYVTRNRDNNAASRARKLSSLKGFFKYLTSKTGQLSQNPAADIEAPKIRKSLPKYLSLDESLSLLKNIQSDFYERDYCMITLFLNCGMRLSELVNIRVSDIKENTLRVLGKGNKERIVYLNDACLHAIKNMMLERDKLEKLPDKNALFVSKNTGRQLSARRVQQIVAACLKAAGLDGKGYSVHKLRHTAATLMYQHGHVDLLVLKEILGHSDVSTTEIYTHLESIQLEKALKASPLAKVKAEKPEPNVENFVEKVEKPEKCRNNDDDKL